MTSDLAQLVLEVSMNLDSGEPRDVAKVVLDQLDDCDFHAALEETLPDYVRHVLHSLPRPISPGTIPTGGTSDVEPSSADPVRLQSIPNNVTPGQSRKFAWLNRYTFAPELGHKLIFELTFEEVKLVAAYKWTKANEVRGVAERWDQLAAYLAENDIHVVGDADPAVVRNILQDGDGDE